MPASRFPLTLLASSLLLVACGGGPESGTGDRTGQQPAPRDAGQHPGEVEHVDGIIRTTDDGFVLEPRAAGREALEFRAGPEVERSQLRALEAAGTDARVSYRADDGERVAVAVAQAPRIDEGLHAYEGEVVSVADSRVVVEGADGRRTFRVDPRAGDAFDLEHLREHADSEHPVIIHYRPEEDVDGGVAMAYEDA